MAPKRPQIMASTQPATDKKVPRVGKGAERRYQNLLKSSPMGIHLFRLEPDGRLVFTGANPAADQLLRVDNSPLLGLDLEEAF
ncbi:MAG: PAS domain-containing protein, partial [Humidesulfovibrio sp.]|nr:PAS domain-containing protein [Humidesulfovibrio sp.]